MTDRNIVPLAQPQAPSISFAEMQQLAVAIAKSGLFGIKTPEQALALMAISQAEGRHPALAARDYHIIGTTPSKKAEAMLRDFFSAGGKVEWHALNDDIADATFSHPIGGTVRIAWDVERVRRAGLNKDNHQKYPRAMKRSRCVSEGVRTVWPLATSGFYVPEEVVDFDQSKQAAPPADARTDLDGFAAAKPAEIIDQETGEVIDATQIEREARSSAAQGTEHFREHLRALGKEARAALKPLIGTREAPGELTILAQRTDAAMRDAPQDDAAVDEFGLPVLPERGEAPPSSPAGPSSGKEMAVGGHAPAGDDRPRDEEWWNRERVTLGPCRTGREFQAEMHRRLRECRNWAEVERLRDDNEAIDALDRPTREAVLGEMADRERELRASAEGSR